MKESIQNALSTPMTRSEFVRNIAVVILAVSGGSLITQIIKGLSGEKSGAKTKNGYGTSAYGR